MTEVKKEKKTYPSPKDGKRFLEMWYRYLPAILDNPKFREHHLDSLEILCSLHQDAYELEQALELLGKTFETVDKGITRVRPRPEVIEIGRIRQTIKGYLTILGLTLVRHRERKDLDPYQGASKGETDKWD
jgi:hypothetical protein